MGLLTHIFLCEFDLIQLSNPIHGMGSIEFDCNSVRLGSIDYAGDKNRENSKIQLFSSTIVAQIDSQLYKFSSDTGV